MMVADWGLNFIDEEGFKTCIKHAVSVGDFQSWAATPQAVAVAYPDIGDTGISHIRFIGFITIVSPFSFF